MAVKYFNDLFAEQGRLDKLNAMDILGSFQISSLESADSDALAQPIDALEIKKAMFSDKNNKAPGPNGFNAELFKADWDVVGDKFTAAIQFCFRNKYMYHPL